MKQAVPVSNSMYWIGVNDRRTAYFENLWPLDKGISYNSYVVMDQKTALIDTVDSAYYEEFEEKLDDLLNGRKVDYLVINHIEPDHGGGIGHIIKKYPGVEIIANKKTKPMLEGYFGITENIRLVNDGEELVLGNTSLRFYLTSLVHWPETMMTYHIQDKVLFSGDAFGTFGTVDGGLFDKDIKLADYNDEIRRYYSNIVGKYAKPVQKALKKLSDIEIDTICPTHGPIWQDNIMEMLANYEKWSNFDAQAGVVVAYGSMYGNTAKMADYLALQLKKNGIQEVKVYDVSKTHVSYIISDIFKYKGVLFGTPTYNGEIFPLVGYLLQHLDKIKIKNRIMGVFGNQSWSGGGVRKLNAFAETLKWELAGESVETFATPRKPDFEAADALAKALVEKLEA